VVTAATLSAWAGACSPTPQFGSDTTSTATSTTASSGGLGGAGGATASSTSASVTAASSASVSSSTGGGSTVASSSVASSSAASSGTVCTPKTCPQLGAECGSVSDGCTETLQCGTCTQANYVCGAKTPNQCGCVPQTCASLGANCGSVSNGCGDVIPCGACTGSEGCGAGGHPNVCDVALSTSCGGCSTGYQTVALIYDQVCYPTLSCMAQTVYDEICYRGPGMATVYCGGTCPSQTHPGASYPSCSCVTNLLVCIPDPT
jgi:hypothetical protein